MKKADRTKAHIEKYVQFFKAYVGDAPTQKEVAENTNIPYRTVQRYFNPGKSHQYNQIGYNRLKGDSYAADKFSNLMFDFWREVDNAPPQIKVNNEDIYINWKKYRELCEVTGTKHTNKYRLDYWIKNKMNRPTKSVYSIGALQIQKGVDMNTYFWEHTLRLFQDGTLIVEVPTSREFFDSLAANEKLWSKRFFMGLWNERERYREPDYIQLTYLGECEMFEPSEEKEIKKLVEVEKVLEENDSPFIGDIIISDNDLIEDNTPFLFSEAYKNEGKNYSKCDTCRYNKNDEHHWLMNGRCFHFIQDCKHS